MSEMVTRVAEATAISDGFKSLASVPREKREGYERRARAAIEAMREPTLEMEKAAQTFIAPYHDIPDYYMKSHVPDDFFRLAFGAMIRAALTDGVE